MAREFVDKNRQKHFDDETIESNEGFLRRIPGNYWNKAEGQLSSGVFGPEDMSFCLESLISHGDFHNFFPQHGLLRLRANQLRGEGEVLERDPCGDHPCEKAHALSWGKRNKARKRKIRDMAEILFPPPQ